ncbi:MAG: heavy metal translocating P-type ATPase [Candidatus Saccharimonadales bacterium]
MKRFRRFLSEYRLFSLAVVTVIGGLILDILKLHTASHYLLSIVSIIAVIPLLYGMLQTLKSGTYGIDILAATAIIASVILGQFWAAIVIVLMLTGGESLEDYAQHKAKSELRALLEHAPHRAHLIRKGKTVDVTVSQLRTGDKIIIRPGELVPVDCLIVEGTASFDESSLTGESLPQSKIINDQLLSGSINLDGSITAKATASAEDSQYQQIIKLVRGAATAKAPFVRLADRYSLPFTLLAYALASGAWIISGQPIRFLEVIVVATPCPLLLAAPIALISGMARASKYGIIVKTGGALEKLAEVKTIAFDKTGTLTKGELAVDKVVPVGNYDEAAVLAFASGLEQNSNHLVALAIVAEARKRNIKFKKAKHITEYSGRGLKAVLSGQTVLVGRYSLLAENGIKVTEKHITNNAQQTAVFIAIDDNLVGIISLKDELRPEAISTIERLKSLGVKDTMIITGDNKATAQAIASSLGITHVHYDMLPADKLKTLEEVRKRPLAFVGDGVNDAPVLSGADVGIALGARGSTAASESADMVIMLDDLGRVAAAMDIAKQTFKIAKQSILVGIGLSVALMLIFATGKFPPLAGAIVQEFVDVIVIFNALRAHLITFSE